MRTRSWLWGVVVLLTLAGCTGGHEQMRACVWRIVPAPDLGPDGGLLSSVLAFSDRNVWAVRPNGTEYEVQLYHWDGRRWTGSPTPRIPDGSNHVLGLAGTGPNDVWAVGTTFL